MITKDDMRIAISHKADGPITAFALIRRATMLAKQANVEAEWLANALFEELQDRKMLK